MIGDQSKIKNTKSTIKKDEDHKTSENTETRTS
jgi:hypothetical protein